MSYDVSMKIFAGNKYAWCGKDHNYTYNCSPMFYLALSQGGFENGIDDLNGKTGAQCIDTLEKAVSHMNHPDNAHIYKEMNPPNGWGDYESALRFLQNLLEDARSYPLAEFHVS